MHTHTHSHRPRPTIADRRTKTKCFVHIGSKCLERFSYLANDRVLMITIIFANEANETKRTKKIAIFRCFVLIICDQMAESHVSDSRNLHFLSIFRNGIHGRLDTQEFKDQQTVKVFSKTILIKNANGISNQFLSSLSHTHT